MEIGELLLFLLVIYVFFRIMQSKMGNNMQNQIMKRLNGSMYASPLPSMRRILDKNDDDDDNGNGNGNGNNNHKNGSSNNGDSVEDTSPADVHLLCGCNCAECKWNHIMSPIFEDHWMYTRMAIMSILRRGADEEVVVNRLLNNVEDVAGLISSKFEGDVQGDVYRIQMKLWTDHIIVAKQIVESVRDDHGDETKRLLQIWSDNGKSIADSIYSLAMPTGVEDTDLLGNLRRMFQEHLDTTTDEVVARSKEDWEADIVAADKVAACMREMKDALAGLFAQN